MPLTAKDWMLMPKQFEELLQMLPSHIPEVVYGDYLYGEWGISFYAICDWLYTNDVPISQDVFAKLEEMGAKLEEMGTPLSVPNEVWEALRSQVI